ncbi:MAG: hypothetical protein HFH08_00375 [Bacilli bacterium]|nr:hypothetical protein [Bacilli bacterium]
MNKKGQVLVLFLILLPFLLLLVGFIVDIGMAYNEKRKIEHAMRDSISYALDHIKEEESTLKVNMTHLLKENIKDIYEIRIEIKNEKVSVGMEKRIDTIFLSKDYTIKLSYQGEFINGKKRIKKEG